MTARFLLVALAASLLPTSASAVQRLELKKDEPGAAGIEVSGEYRVQGSFLTDFAVDAEGTQIGQSAVLDHRLRFRFDLQVRIVRFSTEWDISSGQLVGDLWDIPGTVDARNRHAYGALTPAGFIPRRAAVTVTPNDSVVIEAGLVTSHWGLGMLANNGATDPFFGRNDFGDRVVRFRFTGRPAAPLFVTGAFDWVIGDDIGEFGQQQLAFQGLGSVVYRDLIRQAGLYAVYRHQEESDGRATDVVVFDLFVDRWGDLFKDVERTQETGWSLRLAAEGALIVGRTNRSLSYNEREALTVISGGLTGVATLYAPEKRVGFHVRGGLGSSDGDSDDGFSTDFAFDRDFDVGFVLFDHVQGGVEAATHALVTDPENTGYAPDGAEVLATEGSFRRGVFLQPIVTVAPAPWLEFRLGVAAAATTAPVRHPFYAFRAGGSDRNHHNVTPSSRYLGTEIDWAVRLGGELPVPTEEKPRVEALIQGGHAILGGALRSGEEEEVVHHLLLTGRFRW